MLEALAVVTGGRQRFGPDGEVRVAITRDDTAELTRLHIELTGSLRRFPSMTTGTTRFIANKNGVARIVTSNVARQRLKAAKEEYVKALLVMGEPLPSFGSNSVHVLAALADDRYMRDSHNYLKAVCDWLEEIGAIDNDREAEAFAFFKKDYADQFEDLTTTEIFIVDRQRTRFITAEAIRRIRGA